MLSQVFIRPQFNKINKQVKDLYEDEGITDEKQMPLISFKNLDDLDSIESVLNELVKKGRMTYRQLQKQSVSKLDSIEVSDSNIGDFLETARKYDIDYALKRDKSTEPPTYHVFFSAANTESFKRAFTEYLGKDQGKSEKRGEFTREQLEKSAERVAQRPRRHRNRERNRENRR